MGWYRATVVDATDPEGNGRVKLMIPALFGSSSTGWATPLNSGAAPAVGSLVWADHEGNDWTYPVYLKP